ncbi:unnamed protein product [Thlaspi arvense]|uniref:Uncharacterized protein n=1 Tax=Thlaspi arvense TaxID=13288 RepID=A0AAU9TA63_THLAR|nr:unnamed protein product [Thlaspi arvense]
MDKQKQAHLRGFGLCSVGIGLQSHSGSDPLALSKYLPTPGTLEDKTAGLSPNPEYRGDLPHRRRMASELPDRGHGMDHLRLRRLGDRKKLNGSTICLLRLGSRSPGGLSSTSGGKLYGD